MGKVIAKKISGMSWGARIGVVTLCTMLISIFMYQGWYKPKDTEAAIAQQQAWTSVYHSATVPGATAASFAVNAGTNRVLVVAITSSMTSSATQTMTGVTYGGQAMTLASGDASTSSRSHTYLFYLKDNAVMSGTAKTLAVTMSASNSLVHDIYYAVYSGVDQATPLTDAKNSNNSSGSSTAAFSTALNVGAGDQAVVVYNAMNSSGTTIPTVAVPGTFTLGATQTWNTTNGNTSKVVYRTTQPASNTTDTASSTLGTSSRWSMSGLSLKAYAPTVTAASPAAVAPGTVGQDVTISGTNFMDGATVTFTGGGITVNRTTFNSSTSLTVNVTVDAAAATGLRSVTVTNPNGQGVASGSVFSVVSANAPTISAVTPAALGQGASNVSLSVTGNNFDATTTLSCSNPGVTMATSYIDASHLTATVNVTAGAATGIASLTVTNSSDGSSSTSTGALTVTAKPTVSSVSPLNGRPGDTNKNITITGTGFVAGVPLAASFSGTGITVNSVNYVSATQLTANISIDAAATAGGHTVTVVNGDGGVSAAAGSFSVVTAPAPTITSLSTSTLSSYASNFTITINGSNFLNAPAPTVSCPGVNFGTVTFVDANTLKVVVTSNANSSGTGTVTVTNNDSQTATTSISFGNNRPGSSLTAAPAKGSTGQTMNVVLTGSNFTAGATATFGNAGITVNSTTYNSSTQLTANITIASNASAGAGSVTVVNGDGGTRGAVNNVFTVTPVGVTSVTPSYGPGGSGTVTIKGQGFAAGATVAIGGGVSVSSVQYVDASTLTATVSVSAGAVAGAYDVTVTVGSNSATGTGAYTVTAAPAIGTFSPAAVRQGETADVTINGANFANGCSVAFNGSGVTLNSVTFVSASQLTANVSVDADAPITASTVTITNPDGGTSTGGSFAVAPTAKTITGTVSFRNVTRSGMVLVATYSGDGDGDGTCTISYGTTAAYELGTVAAVKGNGAYTATFSNLGGGSDGAGNLYYFRVTFGDADGFIGSSQLAATQPTLGSPLMHNSQNTASSKWAQGWGIEGGKYGAFTCSTCHNKETGNIKMVSGTIQAPSLENWSSTGSGTLTVKYLNPTTDLGSDSAHATSTNVCEACHSRTGHHAFNNAGADHNGTTDCMPCHDHNEGFLPSCQGCHSTPQGAGGYRRAVVGTGGDFVANPAFRTLSTHGAFSTLSSKTCTVCHDATRHQIFSDGVSVSLSNADTGATVLYDGTAATAAATKEVCISCHDADGATRLGASATAPFGSSQDFRSPANVGRYWPASGGAHAVNMYCFNCHGNSRGVDGSTTNPKYNGHASGNDHGVQDRAYDVTNPNAYCFNCHKSASTDPNRSFKNISGQFRKTYKHVTAKCFDCHGDENNSLDSLHSLRAGSQTAASGVMAKNISNATGRSMTWSATSWGGASGSGALPSNQATAEYQVCFKCHAATGSGTTPDVNNASYTNAGALTNLALEFNPNNGSAHPVVVSLNNQAGSVAPKALTAAKMKAPWNVNLGTQVMTCSDCHATDSTASKGPHGSAVKWMLAGTNKAWPYTVSSANGTGTGTLRSFGTLNTSAGTNDGLFCLNCHVVSGTNNFHLVATSFPEEHSSSSGPAQCANCHIRVPHGGKISRLLQTTNVPNRYKANGSSTTPLYSSWGSTNPVKGAGYSGNFRTSCTRHSGSGGEAW